MDITTVFIAFVLGFLARLLSVLAGGGAGLIEVPLLLLLGIPPKVTVATRKFAAIGGHGIAAIQFHKHKIINWKIAIILTVLTVIATIIGTNILISLNDELVRNAMGVMLLIALPFTFLKKSFGIKRKVVSTVKTVIGYVLNFFIFLLDATIGVGGGLLSSLTLITFMGLTYLEATAIRRITGFTLAFVATIIFAYNGLINFSIGIPLLLGGVVGGYLGVKVAITKGSGLIKTVFSLVVLVSLAKLFF